MAIGHDGGHFARPRGRGSGCAWLQSAPTRIRARAAWLDEVQQRMLRVFAKSNLYNCLHTLYGELGVFGTAALWIDEDEDDVVRGYTLTAGEYWLASSSRLAIDTLYRSMWWTVRQIVDTFGRDDVSAGIRGRLRLAASSTSSTSSSTRSSPIRTRRRRPEVIRGTCIPGAAISPAACPGARCGSSAARRARTCCCASRATRSSPAWRRAGTWSAPTAGAAARAGWRWATAGSCRSSSSASSRRSTSRSGRRWSARPRCKNEPASLLPGGITYVADPERPELPAGDRRAPRPRRARPPTSPRSRAASRRRSTPTCS